MDDLRLRHPQVSARIAAIVLRLLFPEEDRRRTYNVQESRLANIVCKMLTARGQDVDLKNLERWSAASRSGCLGVEICNVLSKYPSVCPVHVLIVDLR